MQLKDQRDARLASILKSLRNTISTAGQSKAVVSYRQSRPWHVMSYWLRSSGRSTSGWLKTMIAEQREWLRQPVHLRMPARRIEPAKSRPTILIGRDLTQEQPAFLVQNPASFGELLMENCRLRELIDLLLRFGPDQRLAARAARSDSAAVGALIGSLDIRL